jgi:2-aminoadipate transaminase
MLTHPGANGPVDARSDSDNLLRLRMMRMDGTRFSFSQKARRTLSPPISYLMAEGVTNPNLISLAAGLVDYDSLPVRRVREALDRLLADEAAGPVALQYGTTAGLYALRDALLSHFERLESRSRREFNLTPDNVVITTGSQQMLFLLTDLLVDPGDIVITAAPSYFVYAGVLESAGARVLTVPADADGMRTDVLAALLERCRASGELNRVKLIYVVSCFDNPAGVSVAASRRPEFVNLARTYSTGHRILVVEDAAYRELRYDGPALPSIKAFDPQNEYVALTMTFSKPFSAGMKTGYSFLPGDLVTPVLDQKGNHDFGSANLLQHVLNDLIRRGEYDAHVEELCRMYRHKRDVVLRALDRELGDVPRVGWTRPQGGLYVWLTLPEDVDTGRESDLFRMCVEAGVLYVPGEFCFVRQEGQKVPANHLRLSFGVARPAQIEEGVRRLAACIRRQLASTAPATTAQSVKAV